MTITLAQSDLWELYETTKFTETKLAPDSYEVKGQIPELLGKGQFWEIDLGEGSGLPGETWQKPHDFACFSEEREHEVEICLWLPTHKSVNHDSRYTLLSSGIAPQEI
jgi:hypothetical protein